LYSLATQLYKACLSELGNKEINMYKVQSLLKQSIYLCTFPVVFSIFEKDAKLKGIIISKELTMMMTLAFDLVTKT
jgi:hypothetical protein